MTTEIRNVTIPMAEEHAFIGHLKRLLEDVDRSRARAAMAHLRRGLGKPPGTAYEMDKYVLDQLPEKADEDVYYLVASLFAFWHQGRDEATSLGGERDTDRNLGKSLSKLAAEYAKEGASLADTKKRLEKLLDALLSSHHSDLRHHVRRVTALLRSGDIPVNWAQLLHDLQHWDTESRFVQHAWAKGFWIEHRNDRTTGTADSKPEQEV